VIERVKKLSERYGTKVVNKGDVGVVEL